MAAVPQYFMDLETDCSQAWLCFFTANFLYLTIKEVNIPYHHLATDIQFLSDNLPPIHGAGNV